MYTSPLPSPLLAAQPLFASKRLLSEASGHQSPIAELPFGSGSQTLGAAPSDNRPLKVDSVVPLPLSISIVFVCASLALATYFAIQAGQHTLATGRACTQLR